MRQTHHITVYGPQREQIDLDLLAQIVIMLGRQLAAEAAEMATAHGEPSSLDRESPA